MTTSLPSQQTKVEKALRWITDELKNDEAGTKSAFRIIGEATTKFDLSPNEETVLWSIYQKKEEPINAPDPEEKATGEVLILTCEKCDYPIDPKCKCS